MPTPRMRAGAVVLAAVSVVSLAACGSDGVLTDGNVASKAGANTVTTEQVQSAIADVRAFNPQTDVTPGVAAVLLALAPQIAQIAGRNGSATSTSQIEQLYRTNGYPKGKNPSEAGLRLGKASSELNAMLTGNANGQRDSQRLLATTDVTLNPRYGNYVKGKGLQPGTTDWIKPTAAPTTAPS